MIVSPDVQSYLINLLSAQFAPTILSVLRSATHALSFAVQRKTENNQLDRILIVVTTPVRLATAQKRKKASGQQDAHTPRGLGKIMMVKGLKLPKRSQKKLIHSTTFGRSG